MRKLMHVVDQFLGEDILPTSRRSARESWVLILDGGAVEAWQEKLDDRSASIIGDTHMGGIEVHSSVPREWWADMPSCHWVAGKCWTSGSSLAFESARNLFEDPRGMLALLESWARSHDLLPAPKQRAVVS